MSFFIIYFYECVWGFYLASSCLSFEGWYSLIASINDERKRLIFELLYSSGCSESEIIDLKYSDISVSSSSIKFGNRISILPISLIQRVFSLKKDSNSKYFLSSRQSSKMSSKRLQQIVSETSEQNTGNRITPQDIRTTHVYHALLKNKSVISISEQTGLTPQRIAQIIEQNKTSLKKNSYRYEL